MKIATRPSAPVLLAIGLATLAACGDDGASESETTTTWTTVQSPGEGVTFAIGEVTIAPDASVRLLLRLRTVNGVETENVRTLNGHPFGVLDGTFYLGEHEFGPTPSGSKVRVTAGGVFVDGERRGDMPAPADLMDAPGTDELR
jgi:hypothetical protein